MYNEYKQPIIDKVREVVEMAEVRYGFDIAFDDIVINFKNSGRAAAQAWKKWGQYGLNFNLQSAHIDINEMLNDTVPHEVAHLVNYALPHTGRNHDMGWKRVCIALGGSGERCHDQTLSKTKYRKAYLYITDSGFERIVKSAAKHKRLQCGVRYRIKATGEWYGRESFVRVISSEEHRQMHEAEVHAQMAARNVKPVEEKPAKRKPVGGRPLQYKPTKIEKGRLVMTKMDICRNLFDPALSRAAHIQMFMREAECSKAGASTYYQKIKKERS